MGHTAGLNPASRGRAADGSQGCILHTCVTRSAGAVRPQHGKWDDGCTGLCNAVLSSGACHARWAMMHCAELVSLAGLSCRWHVPIMHMHVTWHGGAVLPAFGGGVDWQPCVWAPAWQAQVALALQPRHGGGTAGSACGDECRCAVCACLLSAWVKKALPRKNGSRPIRCACAVGVWAECQLG